MSVDPYMRGRMSDAKSYAEPYALGEAMHGGAVGVVDRVAAPTASPSATTCCTVSAGARRPSSTRIGVRVVDTSVAPASAYLGVLGMTGLTAYAGLTRVARAQGGRRRLRVRRRRRRRQRRRPDRQGARARAGSSAAPDRQEKVDHLLNDLGFDAAFNYKDGKRLPTCCARPRPTASTSTSTTSAASTSRPRSARSGSAGASRSAARSPVYNNTEPAPGPAQPRAPHPDPRHASRASSSATTTTSRASTPQRAAGWIADGTLTSRETFVDGIDHAVDAFLGVLRGENIGKMLVRL